MWFVPIRRAFRKFGIDLLHAKPELSDMFAENNIDTVIDVGANVGQYARLLRSWGYAKRIVSFEPLSGPYRELAMHASRDPAWQTVNVGLGESDAKATINVSASTVFSSLLKGTEDLRTFDAGSDTIRTEEITVRRLDSVLSELGDLGKNLCLKVDTQGYERQVILGAGDALSRFKCIQLELSTKPLYAGEASFVEMVSLLATRGFRIALLKPFLFDPKTKCLLQSDVLFVPAS